MSRKPRRVRARRPGHKKGPRHVIIARGDRIRTFELKLRWVVFGAILLLGALGGGAYYGATTLLEQQGARDARLAASVQAELRDAYEIRIADMTRQIDTLVGQQLDDRSAIETQIAALAERQQSLNERQQLLTGLADDAFAVGINVLPALAPLPVANPHRTGGLPPGAVVVPPNIGGPVDPITTGAVDPLAEPFDPAAMIAAIEQAANIIENDQIAAVEELAEVAAARADRLADALGTIGYGGGAQGGPYIPIEEGHEDLEEIGNDLADLAVLQATASRLPLAQPVASMSLTSRFGSRRDPFTGRTAMHSGLDMAAATGTQVRATGPGRVVFAGTNGGYGRMVEIDHGNGITTAYGHLNSISVSVGETVARGEVIARSGSTGRSTGPHLHYEVRRNGRAIDPLPWVRVGQQISNLL